MTNDPDALRAFAKAYASAWNSGSPDAVAAHFAASGKIVINRGTPLEGRPAIAEMAAGFFAEFPGMVVRCDSVRAAGRHAVFAWTLEGRHAKTKKFVRVEGWEEWDFDEEGKIDSSLGWFDSGEYERQIREGAG